MDDFIKTLVSAVIGGLMVIAGQYVQDGRKQSTEQKTKRREKYEEFVATLYDHDRWLLNFARTTNAIERLHEEFKRRIKTQTVLPSAETAAMLFWALLASGQISMRKVDGWQTLATKLIDQPIDLAA